MLALKKEPQDIPHILEDSFILYQKTLKLTLPYSFLSMILMSVPPLLSAIEPLVTRWKDPNWDLWSMGICWLLGIVFLSGLIFRLYCFCNHVPSSFLASLQHAFSKIISILLLIALYCIIILGGAMLLIIPGIIFSISLLFSFILVLTDNQPVLQTLAISHRLVWGQWWHTMIVISIPLLLNAAISFTGFLIIFGILTNHGWPFSEVYLATIGFNLIIQTFYIPFVFTVALVLLHDLRQRLVSPPRWYSYVS